jgi:proline iminopeptidase
VRGGALGRRRADGHRRPGLLGRASAVAVLSAAIIAGPAAGQQARQGLLSLEDARLFYEVVGTGDPIVVVHGGPGLDHAYLQPGLNTLANRNTLIYYDQRGTGRSTAELTDSAINIDTFVQDIDALRQVLGYERITVLAHSFGALIGLEYAMRYPDNLRALILMNPVEPGTRYQDQTAERARARRTAEDAEELTELTSSEAFTARDPGTIGQVYRVAFRQLLRDRDRIDELDLDIATETARNGQDVAALLGASLDPPIDWWGRLPGIETPTLVLQGRYDAPPLDMGRALAEAFPAGTYEVLNTGHFPYLEDGEALLAAISGFFATLR